MLLSRQVELIHHKARTSYHYENLESYVKSQCADTEHRLLRGRNFGEPREPPVERSQHRIVFASRDQFA